MCIFFIRLAATGQRTRLVGERDQYLQSTNISNLLLDNLSYFEGTFVISGFEESTLVGLVGAGAIVYGGAVGDGSIKTNFHADEARLYIYAIIVRDSATTIG